MKDCAIAWPEKQRAFETFIECKLVVKVMELHVPVIDGASKLSFTNSYISSDKNLKLHLPKRFKNN